MATWLADGLVKTCIRHILFSALGTGSVCEAPPPQTMGVLRSGDCEYTRSGSWRPCPSPQPLTKGVLVVGG